MIQLLSLNNRLTKLKMDFDKAIMEGSSFAEVKKIYSEMKELERMIAQRQVELLKVGRIEE
jgi:hypothetical protein